MGGRKRLTVAGVAMAIALVVLAVRHVGDGEGSVSIPADRSVVDSGDGPRERPRAADPPQRASTPEPLAEQPRSQTAPPVGSIANDASADLETTASDPREERIAELVDAMAVSAYAMIGERFVDYLVSSGLARADSERLVEQGMQDATWCSVNALREEADAQSVSFDDVLRAVAAGVYQSDGPLIGAMIDVERVRAREAPCLLNVFQQAGVPIAILEELVR